MQTRTEQPPVCLCDIASVAQFRVQNEKSKGGVKKGQSRGGAARRGRNEDRDLLRLRTDRWPAPATEELSQHPSGHFFSGRGSGYSRDFPQMRYSHHLSGPIRHGRAPVPPIPATARSGGPHSRRWHWKQPTAVPSSGQRRAATSAVPQCRSTYRPPPPGGRFRDTLDTTLRRRAWRWSEWSTTSATLGPTLGEGSCLLRRLAAPEFSCPPGVTTRDRARRQRCPSPPGRSRPSFT